VAALRAATIFFLYSCSQT